MTPADKLALLAKIDAAKKAVADLETACCDYGAARNDHEEVGDIMHQLWRMGRRIAEES